MVEKKGVKNAKPDKDGIIRVDLKNVNAYVAAADLDEDDMTKTLKQKETFTGLLITDDGIYPKSATITVDSLPPDVLCCKTYCPSREVLEHYAEQELMDHQLIRIEHHFLQCLTFVFTNNRVAPPPRTYNWEEELDVVKFPKENTGKDIKKIIFGLIMSKEGKKKEKKSQMAQMLTKLVDKKLD